MSDYLEYYGVPPQDLRDVETRPEFYASAGQTVFAVTYQPGYIDVYRNGVLQSSDTFTAASGVNVTFTTACVAGEHIRFTSRRQVAASDVYTKSEAGSLNNNFYTVGVGTGDAATGITVPTVGFTLSDGREVKVRWPAPNTVTNPTFNANSTGAKKLVVSGGHPVPVGAITSDHELTLRYNVTKDYYEITNISDVIFPKSNGLTQLLHPHSDGSWRDIYRAGWRPSWFNQQWGGAQWGTEMVDGATGNLYKFNVATGNVQDDNYQKISEVSANDCGAQGFKVSETTTLTAVWIKIFKVGNPTNSLSMRILPDSGSGTTPTGFTAITNGTAISQSGKLHTSNTNGEWYRFVFPSPPTLTANTFYHIDIFTDGAVNSSNYWGWKKTTNSKYPLGNACTGDSTPVWTASTSHVFCFAIETSSANQMLQPGGQFSNKLVFAEGSPIDQSKSLIQPLRNFYDGTNFTFLTRISSAQKGKPIADFSYGIDHDRIQIATDATTGFVKVNFWDKNRTLVILSATSVDTSANAFTDVAISARTAGDGSDYLQLWVNGTLAASTSSATYAVDPLMRDLGTSWIGGGFPVAPTWTQDMQMTSLPSAQGWTYSATGGVLESTVFSIQNGKLFQNRNNGGNVFMFYTKTVALNNTTGWTVTWKQRTPISNNSSAAGTGNVVSVNDGTKTISVCINEYFVQTSGVSTIPDITIQGDFKSRERVFTLCGKGSDYFLFIDGCLSIDGTGRLTTTTSNNSIYLGDGTTTVGEDADVIWSYLKYYQGGMMLPQASTGCALHETAFWSGNKTSILPALYNAGSPISVKQFCGVEKNYIDRIFVEETRKKVVSGPSTSSTSWVTLPDMEAFVLGSSFEANCPQAMNASAAGGGLNTGVFLDGKADIGISINAPSSGSFTGYLEAYEKFYTNIGLHKIDVRWSVATGSAVSGARILSIKEIK